VPPVAGQTRVDKGVSSRILDRAAADKGRPDPEASRDDLPDPRLPEFHGR